MDWFGFSVFLAWGIKAIILRVGGADLYRKARPFFVGMIPGRGHLLGRLVGHKRIYGPAEDLAVYGLLEFIVSRASGAGRKIATRIAKSSSRYK